MQVVYDYEFWLTATPGIQRQIEAAFLRPDVFHVASSTVVSDMLNSIGVSPRALVVPGIDTDSFRQTVDPAQRAAVIGFPLRPEAHKGTEDALEAAAIISRTRPWVRFVGFGDRWTGPLPAAVTSLGYVTERELVDFYNSLSVFVLPSRYEGWGLPAAEAMACGAAVVCADNGGSRDFAIDGETALIVPPHQPQALADAICRLLDDDNLRKRLADAGKARAQVMSLKASASMLRQAIDQAMEL
jgi:glycosyltransferase involved in cell wall biosynthesis